MTTPTQVEDDSTAVPANPAGPNPQNAAPAPTRRRSRRRTRRTTETAGTDTHADAPGMFWAMRHWRPDRRWFVPAAVALFAYQLVGIAVLVGVWPWLLVLPGAAAGWFGWAAARRVYYPERYGHRQTVLASALAATTGLVGTAWMVYAAHAALLALMPLAVLAIATIALGLWWADVYSRAPRAQEVHAEVVAEQNAERLARIEEHKAAVAEAKAEAEAAAEAERVAASHRALDMWEEIVLLAKGVDPEPQPDKDGKLIPVEPLLTVRDKQITPGGYYVDFVDHPKKPIKFSGFEALVPDMLSIASQRMEGFGIEVEGHAVTVELSEGDLVPEKLSSAHLFRLQVLIVPLPERIDYKLKPPGDIREPRMMGVYKDRQEMLFPLCGWNGMMCGATGAGKSVFANNLIAGVLETTNAEVQVGGTDKLAPLVFPWLLPWLRGEVDRPPFARVAGQDPMEVTQWLADLYLEAKRRNDNLGLDDQHTPTPEAPAIVSLLEEASNLLLNFSHVKVPIRLPDSDEVVEWNAARIIAEFCSVSRSASMSLFFLTQYGIQDALGPHGQLVRRNLTIRVVGRTFSHSDASSVLTAARNINATQLPKNLLLVQPDSEVPRIVPGKVTYVRGPEIIGRIVKAYTGRRPTWAPREDTRDWRQRWNPEKLPQLVANARKTGLEWPVEKGSPGFREVGPLTPQSTTTTPPAAAAEPPADETLAQPDPAHSTPPWDTTTGTAGTPTRAESDPADRPIKKERSMSSKVNGLLDAAKAKMRTATAKMAEYGPLGEFMDRVFRAVNAENAPEFITAARIAHMLGEIEPSDPQDKIDAASRSVIERMGAEPWKLEPVTGPTGKLGWTKQSILDMIRYQLGAIDLDAVENMAGGVPAARSGDSDGPGPEQPSPARATGLFVTPPTGPAAAPAPASTTVAGRLVAAIDAAHPRPGDPARPGSDGRFITYTDAGQLVGMSGSQLQQALGAEGLSMTRVRTEAVLVGGGSTEGRPRGWYVDDLRKRAAQG